MNSFARKKIFLSLFALLSSLIFAFQNCSDVGFQKKPVIDNPVTPTSVKSIAINDQRIDEGERLKLVAFPSEVVSNPVYVWFFKGDQIAETSNPKFVVTNNAQRSDHQGSYRVEYYDGDVFLNKDSARVDVARVDDPDPEPEPEEEPLVIEDHPRDENAKTGDNFTFEVKASGPDLKYQWLKDGKPIQGAREKKFKKKAELEDDGKYSVVVSNRSASVESKKARLKVETRRVTKRFSLGGNGCGKGYCAAAIAGRCGSKSKDKADKICQYKGYEKSTSSKKSASGVVGAKYCGPSGKHCFTNANARCNPHFTSVTCVREE